MKIVIFAPHPDDEIFGCGGSMLKWIEQGHEVHIIFVTDNRALISWGIKQNQIIEEKIKDYIDLSDDEIASIALKEAEDAAKAYGIPSQNVHLFKFHDLDAINNLDLGITMAKQIIKNAERIVLPGDINSHPDHRATHIIAKRAAKQIQLNAEYFVYYSVSPIDKQIKIKTAEYREQLYDLMKIYKTQLCQKGTNAAWGTLNRRRSERFGVYKLEDMNKYENF